MARWFERHRAPLEAVLEPGERLIAADRVIASGRRRLRHVPLTGFVLAVTDARVVAIKASTWLARPQQELTSWRLADGARLASAPFGRLRLVLPDRSVVTLRPYGLHRIGHLAPD